MYHKISLIKVAWDMFRVKNIQSGAPSEPLDPWGKEKLSYYITILGKAKPSYGSGLVSGGSSSY